MPYISVVTPVYGCNTSLIELYIRLKQTLEVINNDFEIIMVNDGSTDGAWETIVALANKDHRIKGLNLSRNFGQHYAITAGLDFCSGEWVVVMDCDLQDQPEEILNLHSKAQEGFDIVFGRRYHRKDNLFKKIISKLFYKIYNYLSDSNIDNSVASFSISRKVVIENLRKIKEQNRSFLLYMYWVGFNKGFIDISHSERKEGESSYNFKKMLDLAINAMISFSNKPLRLAIKVGVALSFLSGIYIGYIVIKNLIYGTNAVGWTSLIAAIFFSTGLIISMIGMVGLYIARIFDEVKKRPLYILKDKTNF